MADPQELGTFQSSPTNQPPRVSSTWQGGQGSGAGGRTGRADLQPLTHWADHRHGSQSIHAKDREPSTLGRPQGEAVPRLEPLELDFELQENPSRNASNLTPKMGEWNPRGHPRDLEQRNQTMETTTQPQTIWELFENPPKFTEETSALAEWSLNYDIKTGTPFQIFLDLIGYSSEHFGTKLFGGDFSKVLGFMELDYLGDALKEYAEHPYAVGQFLAMMFDLEANEGNK